MSSAIHRILPPPDERTTADIDRDLDDELAFHLHMIEQELVDEGLPRAEAARRARARFGDVDRIRAACRRIAMRERTMHKVLNVVLAMLLVIVIAVALFAVFFAKREADVARAIAMEAQIEAETESQKAHAMNAFLQDLLVATDPERSSIEVGVAEVLAQAETQLESGDFSYEVEARLRSVIEETQRRLQMEGAQPRIIGPTVYIGGDLQRAGVYNLPTAGRLTLSRLLASAAVEFPAYVELRRPDGEDSIIMFRALAEGLESVADDDVHLEANDLVTVRRQ